MTAFRIGSLGVTPSAYIGALIVDLIIQLTGWAISASLQTDKLYDALGSTTFVALAIGTLTYAHFYYARQVVATVLVCIWGIRLGGFLVFRVIKAGGDSRFKDVKDKPLKYLIFWLLQALWVWVTLFPVMVLNALPKNPGLWPSDIVGGVMWAIGFVCECLADFQKYNFKQDPKNKGKFIDVGIWRWSQFPNYFGEMMQWWGIWLLCLAAINTQKGYYVTIISPLFLMALLLFVSGIPIQKKQANERYGKNPDFRIWQKSTPLLVPFPKYKFMKVSKQDVEQQLRAQMAEDESNDEESQNTSSQGRRNASRS
ncbi:hypothetical protein WJX74_008814 [Apatococcus lobatus]|uniref:Steroid 5-alpha reductase C-terminal domain-containing protein n=1 Tax=Apatococcus lobatus TaxID=904363 RepID=A0AAW1QD57_9CHLO